MKERYGEAMISFVVIFYRSESWFGSSLWVSVIFCCFEEITTSESIQTSSPSNRESQLSFRFQVVLFLSNRHFHPIHILPSRMLVDATIDSRFIFISCQNHQTRKQSRNRWFGIFEVIGIVLKILISVEFKLLNPFSSYKW